MKRIYLALILLSTLLVGCKPDPEAPTVVTREVLEITADSAKVVCEVVNDGRAEVTVRGVCWSTSQNPTIDDDKTEDGTGIGVFTSQLHSLNPNTTYYVRAYAVNNVGVSYGDVKNFTTEESAPVMSNQVITVNGVSFTMIAVEGGTFNMGAQNVDPNGLNYDSEAYDREAPVHSVTLSDFYIGETEVTQELWEAVMGYNMSHFEGAQKPVEQITWHDCRAFITILNQFTGKEFRLLTEAEWEFAARGGNKSQGYKYSGSDVLEDVAWYKDNSGSETHDVKTKTPNELGVYDMCGNVLEWCQDYFAAYSSEPQVDPVGPSSGTDCVIRGSSCLSSVDYCRVPIRCFLLSGGASYGIGLRLAM